MQSFLKFLQYHNAVPLAAGVMFLGAGGAFAATNPEAIYSATERVVSTDNTYIANKDLSSYTPKIVITKVEEDETKYYVAYNFYTIDVENYVWRDVIKANVLTVNKKALGQYGDLGVYATEQFNQLIGHEGERLAETQKMERPHLSQKMVATAYGGLIGKFLDNKTDVLPGYTPVVVRPVPQGNAGSGGNGGGRGAAALGNAPPGGGGAGAPVIQPLGNNPALIQVRTMYVDLGAVVTDDKDHNIGVHTFLNGKEVTYVSIDTSTTSEWLIRYQATDNDGNVGSAERRVIVYDPAFGVPNIEQTSYTAPPPPPVPATEPPPPPPPTDTKAPVITINGSNPAEINIGDTYSDLGATVTDNVDPNPGIKASIDGGAEIGLSSIYIDTSVAGTHTIEYRATDTAGNLGTAIRTVNVIDPSPPSPSPADPGTTTPPTL